MARSRSSRPAARKTTPRKSTVKTESADTTEPKPKASALAEATADTRRRSGATREKAARAKTTARTRDDKDSGRPEAPIKKNLAHRLYTGEVSYDFMKNRKKWYIVSAVLLLICGASLVFRGLNLGIEFTGGTVYQVPTQVTSSTSNDFAKAVVDTGLPEVDGTSVVTIGDHTARVQTRSMTPEEISQVRQKLSSYAGVTLDEVTYSTVGGSWGKQITEKGVQALVVFLVLVGLMIWAYFRDWKMSVAALVALLHDLVITVGAYSILGFTVSPATLIGVLTILGYSLYDTVVVFDKVRENVKDIHKQDHTYAEQANLATNQVLVRSINTTVIGVLPVAAILIAALFVLGPGPLEDLGLALFVGMVAGAYSSLFIASPLLAQLREREPAMKEHAAKLGRRDARHARGSKVSAEATHEDDFGVAEDEEKKPSARGSRREVVVNKVGDETPWELEGVEVENPDDLETADEEPPATSQRTRRATRTARSKRRK